MIDDDAIAKVLALLRGDDAGPEPAAPPPRAEPVMPDLPPAPPPPAPRRRTPLYDRSRLSAPARDYIASSYAASIGGSAAAPARGDGAAALIERLRKAVRK